MPTTFEDLAAHLEYVSGRFGLTDDDLAFLFATSPRSVEGWKNRHTRPSAQSTLTILEVLRLIDQLNSLVGADSVRSWLYSANPALGVAQPATMIATGEIDMVEAEVNAKLNSTRH